MPSVQQAFALALEHHQAGRLGNAEAIYRQILTVQPNHAEAWHRLGIIAHQVGRHDVAVDLLRRALVFHPHDFAAHCNLGAVFAGQGRLDEAAAAYRRALELKPDLADAHNNLGNVLKDQGRLDEAVAAYARAIEIRPDYAVAHNNLGNALKAGGNLDGAIAEYGRALQLQPHFAEVSSNLGNALAEQGRLTEAIAAHRQAIQMKADYAPGYNNLGNALKDNGQLDEALTAYRRALQLQPNSPEAHNNLGTVLTLQSDLDEAVLAYQRALQLQPDYAEAYSNLGHALKAKGELDESLTALRRALELKPGSAEIHSSLILTALYHPASDPLTMQEECRRWEQQHAQPLCGMIKRHVKITNPSRRLRVGYVSPDFRDHVAGRNLIPLFQAHDHEQFEIYCYSGVRCEDSVTAAFRRCADRWSSTLGVTDDKVAGMIRRDGVDILVDLSQHMAGGRLLVFARQPAPVQISFAGYPASAGLEAIGYRISDRYLEKEPAAEQARAKERVYLIDSFWCYDPCGIEVEINELPARNAQGVTFGSLNNFCKINEPVLRLWARLLRQVKDSRLILLSGRGSQRQRTLDILAREGVEASRVEFAALCSRKDYLKLYHQLDVALDPSPYNGHTTSLDALWMGVPVVSVAGGSAVSRAGLSQLANLGLSELVAFSENRYIETATQLARDLPRLMELRATLRGRMEASLLMDAPRFVRSIEAVYRTVWERECGESNGG